MIGTVEGEKTSKISGRQIGGVTRFRPQSHSNGLYNLGETTAIAHIYSTKN